MDDRGVILAILVVVAVLLTLYIVIRDREINRKAALLERAIDILNKEIYKVAQKSEAHLDEIIERVAGLEARLENRDESRTMKESAERQMMEREIRRLKEAMTEQSETMQARLAELEGKIRQMTIAVDHAAPDEQTILKLHAAGMNAESIAKKLRMGKGEVELVLRFAKMKG